MKRQSLLALALVGCTSSEPISRRADPLWQSASSLPAGVTSKYAGQQIYSIPGGALINQVSWPSFESAVYTTATNAWTKGPLTDFTDAGVQLADRSIVSGNRRLDASTLKWTTLPGAPGATGAPKSLVALSGTRLLASVPTASGERFATYDASTSTWKVLTTPTQPVVVALLDGRVVVSSTGLQLLDPTSDTLVVFPSPASVVALRLASGKLLATGAAGTETYDPVAAKWSNSGPAPAVLRNDPNFVQFGADRVLMIGGRVTGVTVRSTEIYRISSATWTTVASLGIARESALVSTLDDGRVLVAGGISPPTGPTSTESTPTVEVFGTLDGQTCTNRLDCVSDQCVDGVCCATACAADEVCNSATAKGVCKKKNGVTCTAGTECASGQCVDGVCCNSACGGQCQACDVAGAVGTCTATKGAPHGTRAACTGAGTGTTCGPTCDGSTADKCTFPGASLPCGSNSCVDGFETLASSCDGAGKCAAAPKSCGDYGCDTDRCKTACSVKADCSPGRRCAAGKCIPIEGLGNTCTTSAECSSGFCTDGVCCEVATCGAGASCALGKGVCKLQDGTACSAATAAGADALCASKHCVDGVCCNEACDAQCMACNAPGKAGTCTPIVGPPRGTRPACDDGGGDVCKARTCNGAVDTATCAGFKAASGTACAAARCEGATFTGTSSCNAGACNAPTSISCAPYACDAEGCKSKCAVEADCAPAHACVDGRCRPKQARCSADKSTAIDVDGKETPCSPFLCRADGRCADACGLSTDCALGFACDAESRKCIPPAVVEEGGCAMGRSSSAAALPVLFALGLLGRTRRRRSAAT